MTRWHLTCDHCDASVWTGARGQTPDAWCEACQRPAGVASGADAGCPRCGAPLTLGAPRFEELYGELQQLEAVLAAWTGDAAPLARLLPERPVFLTDLDPPDEAPGDPPALVGALEQLAAGEFAAARVGLESASGRLASCARADRALAIACERLGDPAAAERAHDAALARAEDPRERLARGAVRARRGDLAAAREDFARAGDGREARWNRAAAIVLDAVQRTPGLPDAAVLARARAEAGEPSAWWSDHTVGRLLWTLLAGRAAVRSEHGAHPCPDARVLRAAARELEFDTFWDRALVLESYARLGLAEDAAAVARPLATGIVGALRAEPALRGAATRTIAETLARVAAEVAGARPRAALALVNVLTARADLARYRIPCAACGRGTIGVEAVMETSGEDEPELSPSP